MSKESPFDAVFGHLCRNLNDSQKIDVISKDFMRLSDDFQRIKFLLSLEPVHKLVQIPAELLAASADSKSVQKSIEFRNSGNRLFREKKYLDALLKYTQSLAYAPVTNTGDEFCNTGCNPNARGSIQTPLATQSDNYCNVTASSQPEISSTDKNSTKITNVETKMASASLDDCASLAYANRSAILFHLGQYTLCLDDVNAALAHEYPHKLRYKLYDRRARCHLALGQKHKAIKSFETAMISLKLSDLDAVKRHQVQKELEKSIALCNDIGSSSSQSQRDEQNHSNSCNGTVSVSREDFGFCHTYELKTQTPQFTDSPNQVYPSLSSAASVAYEENRGRFIVAARDIVPGDVILIERPYASVLLPERYYDHCRHCYRHTLAPLPCQRCPAALYCCAECRSLDARVHAEECRGGLLEILRLSGVDKFAFLAIRSVATLTLESLVQLRSVCFFWLFAVVGSS